MLKFLGRDVAKAQSSTPKSKAQQKNTLVSEAEKPESWSAARIRYELKLRGLACSGTKAAMKIRLRDAMKRSNANPKANQQLKTPKKLKYYIFT